MSGMLDFDKLEAGVVLPAVTREVRQEDIDHYARASGDFNPIHIDRAFAAATPLGGTVAHGMLVLAYVTQAVTSYFGRQSLFDGRLSVRFKAPARPGDTLTIQGKIKSIDRAGGTPSVACSVTCQNQSGEAVIIGEATVRLPATGKHIST